MFRRLWIGLLRLFGLRKGQGSGNARVIELAKKDQSDWVWEVTGVVVWVKPVTDEERSERRRRFWRHLWRSLKEMFGSPPDHTNRYPHQIFNLEIEGSKDLVIRVENNLYSGRELKGVEKGWRVEVGGEFLPNDKGGKIHHTHGRKGYVRLR